MDRTDLKTSLDKPHCRRCKTARIRPIGINGKHLMFDCPSCQWRGRAELPEIRKTIIYLDTSTVSHIASAKRAGNAGSKWLLLYEALRESAADDVICCVDSSILQREAELSRYAEEIVAMSREFGDPHPRHELDVQHEQLFRALDRFLSGTAPIRETSPPWKDAFEKNPHEWNELFRLDMDSRYARERVESMRLTKTNVNREVTEIYAGYAADGLGFEEIRKLEASGFGRGIIADGRRAIEYRRSLGTNKIDENLLGSILMTTFDLIIHHIKEQTGHDNPEASGKPVEFLSGEHVSTIPIADIGSRLHAALAMAARGPKPRAPSPSDSCDIAHVETFMPYVDIFIVDRFVAALCNRSDIRLGDDYGTKIRSLGERDIDQFVEELGQLRVQCLHTGLVHSIHQSIKEGGYIQERTEALTQWLRRRGVS